MEQIEILTEILLLKWLISIEVQSIYLRERIKLQILFPALQGNIFHNANNKSISLYKIKS